MLCNVICHIIQLRIYSQCVLLLLTMHISIIAMTFIFITKRADRFFVSKFFLQRHIVIRRAERMPRNRQRVE